MDERDRKILAGAAALLKRTTTVARRRARIWADRCDPRAAARWTEIADAAELLLAKIRETTVREPTLSDILSGSVTRQTMRADQVKRRDVERLVKRAVQRRKA